jgi:hypothetical protein
MDHCSVQTTTPDDICLSSIHVLFIVFSFSVALTLPWYWGAVMIAAHATHEKIVGDCLLSRIQKRRGFSGPEDDFFFHLFCRLGIPQPRKVTSGLHLVIKTAILLIVLARAAAGWLAG